MAVAAQRIPTQPQAHIYAWGNNPRRAELKGRECIVLTRGTMNMVLVGSLDTGEQVATSRNGVRRRSPAS